MRALLPMLLCLFLTLSVSAQQASYSIQKQLFQPNKKSHLIADKVHIRVQPNTQSDIVATLPIGTEICIDDRDFDKNRATINQLDAPWVSCKFFHQGAMKKGYIWAGFLAIESFYNPETKERFLLGIASGIEGQLYQVNLQIRVGKEGKELARHTFKSNIGDDSYALEFVLHGNKGLTNITNVVKISSIGYRLHDKTIDKFLFWDGKQLHQAFTLISSNNSPQFKYHTVLFPNDQEGKKGRIIVNDKSGEVTDDAKEIVKKDETTTYIWKNNQLIKQ